MLRRKGFELPKKGYDVRGLRAKSRDWLFARAGEYRPFGDECWTFVLNCQRGWASHLVIIAALSVLSEELQMNLEMVALSTTSSHHLERAKKKARGPEALDPKQRLRLDRDLDRETRKVCEAT